MSQSAQSSILFNTKSSVRADPFVSAKDAVYTVLYESASLHDAARKATNDIHQDLHSQPLLRSLFSPGLNADQYLNVVRVFDQLYADVAKLLQNLLREVQASSEAYFHVRDEAVGKVYLQQFLQDTILRQDRDCARLSYDLAALSEAPSAAKEYANIPNITGMHSHPLEIIIAWRYLSEGSRLGSSVIHRQLVKLDWYKAALLNSFYRLRTAADEAVWNSLVALLNGQVHSVNRLECGAASVQFDVTAFLQAARFFFSLTLDRFNQATQAI